MKFNHPLAWMFGAMAFAMNPALACSSSDADEFEYGETEMVAAVQGPWQLTYERPEGTSFVTFNVVPGPSSQGALSAPPSRTPQCGTRTFTRPAAACSPASQLALAAAVVEANPPLDTADGKGWYTVYGVKYGGGQLDLTFGPNLRMSAELETNNAIRQSYVDWQGARVTSVLTRAFVK